MDQNHKILYMNLLVSGKSNSYLAGIDKEANNMFPWLLNKIAKRENVTGKLKTENAALDWQNQ